MQQSIDKVFVIIEVDERIVLREDYWTVPIPDVGDTITEEGYSFSMSDQEEILIVETYTVESRDFLFNEDTPDEVIVTLHVKETN